MCKFESALLTIVFGMLFVTPTSAQTTAFTYQGSLTNAANPATGNYDFEFALFDALAGGVQQGSILAKSTVAVANGVFTVSLDFGNQFPGADRFLEIKVRQTGGGGFTLLAPRQQLNSTPYSVKSLTATNATQLNGQSAAFYQNASNLNAGTLSLTGTSIFQIIRAQNDSNLSDSAAILGISTAPDGASYGVYGINSSINGAGVRGETFASSGPNFGVYGQANSTQGVGVYGYASANSGTTYGVYGLSTSPDGFAGFFNGRSYFHENVGIGTQSPVAKLHVSGTGTVRARINSNSNAGFALTLDESPGWSFATVTGGQFRIFNDGLWQNAVAVAPANNYVGIGTIDPLDRLHVNGIIRVATLGGAGTDALCRNVNNQISTCSSSLRYKTNVDELGSGLGIVKQLEPITFDWKDGGMRDLGLGAEDVAAIDPLLVTYNDKGEVEGVKYDRIGVVLVNAVKEQQTQIESQQEQIESQQQQIAALGKLVCEMKPEAETCIRP
jgi:hypothetical protein